MRFTADFYRAFMVKHFMYCWTQDKTTAKCEVEFFGFRPEDVQEMHTHKQGAGRGNWFRLKDGRVIDKFAQPAVSDPAYYDATTH